MDMSNYLGVRCPVCNKKYTQSDDIVVCPVCGAPHHRECYAKTNECAFQKDHINGNVWRTPSEASAKTEEVGRLCPSCKSKVEDDSLFCHICGTNLNNPYNSLNRAHLMNNMGFPGMEAMHDPDFDIYGGIKADETIAGVSAKELAVYIGHSSAYYLPRFAAIDKSGGTISTNFSAFFLSAFYYLYRKMYIIGGILLAIYAIGVVPGLLYAKEALPLAISQMGLTEIFIQSGFIVPSIDQADLLKMEHYRNLASIAQIIIFAISAVMSMCANKMYFDKAIKDISRLKENYTEADGKHGEYYMHEIAKFGGINRTAPVVMGAAIICAYFIINTIIMYSVLG